MREASRRLYTPLHVYLSSMDDMFYCIYFNANVSLEKCNVLGSILQLIQLTEVSYCCYANMDHGANDVSLCVYTCVRLLPVYFGAV